MGNDTPISALSDKPKLAVHLLQAELRPGDEPADRSDPRGAGDEPGLDHRSAAEPVRPRRALASTKRLEVRQPILTNATWRRSARSRDRRSRISVAHARHHLAGRRAAPTACARQVAMTCARRAEAGGARRRQHHHPVGPRLPSRPSAFRSRSLLACAAVHHHLIRVRACAPRSAWWSRSGEPREVHHFACLAGYGAEAINPYLAFETHDRAEGRAAAQARRLGDRQALHQVDRQGPLKVMSKMGISTYQSYCGAQIFDAVGLRH